MRILVRFIEIKVVNGTYVVFYLFSKKKKKKNEIWTYVFFFYAILHLSKSY